MLGPIPSEITSFDHDDGDVDEVEKSADLLSLEDDGDDEHFQRQPPLTSSGSTMLEKFDSLAT
jgi:hypothetical protein